MNKRLGSIATTAWLAAALSVSGQVPAGAVEPLPANAERLVLAPLSYLKFCNRNPSECEATVDKASLNAIADRTSLFSINRRVNHAIRPVHKASVNGIETWEINPRAGDCNDFAISKRHELLAHGWSSHLLMLATVLTAWGEPHLVLLVRDGGDLLVLDNLHADIRAVSETDYTWINRQSSSNPNRWVSMIEPPTTLQVASHAQPDAGS